MADSHTASSRTFGRRIFLMLGAGAVVLVGLMAWSGGEWLSRSMSRQTDLLLVDAAERSAALVQQLISDRGRLVELLAGSPAVVDAALAGKREVARLGIADASIDQIEERYAEQRTLNGDTRLRDYLRGVVATADVAEIIVTESHGLNAITTQRTSDFVQRDEEWWTEAIRDGLGQARASYDESARTVSISQASAIREGATGIPAGVIKVVFGVRNIDAELSRATRKSGVSVDLIDESGRVVASSSTAERMQPLAGLTLGNDRSIRSIGRDSSAERVALAATEDGRWFIAARMPERVTQGPIGKARRALFAGAAGMVVLIAIALLFVSRFVSRRVTAPAAVLALAAERVARGDLTSDVIGGAEDDEIGRLGRATETMVGELRRLVSAIRDSAQETAAMSAEITAGSEQMSASASEMARTSSELSEQSADMAQTIQRAAVDAGTLREIAERVSADALDGVRRNTRLRVLATENRARLDQSAVALETLTSEAETSAAATAELALASEEIRAFVTLVRKIARQSKLLALNASMEAARAGEQGEGFAVVASEIRTLAATAHQAAERTERLVNDVLSRVEASRDSSKRTVATVSGVRLATREAVASFEQVEAAVVDAENWASATERAAADSSALVREMTDRLDDLARGTESFAAAMQEVAASSQEQSASTEEIAAAASVQAVSAQRLSDLVATFRLAEQKVAVTKPMDKSSNGRAPVLLPAT
ncbi:MAG: methyl-accepting chemotaxis protein [Anaerolineae bacterium]|nr:methyl-accepting chemotaxis protein [Gemmatimonadaceae bacterium]